MKHFTRYSLSDIREMEDPELIELGALAWYLDERELEQIKVGVNQAIAAAFGEGG